MFHISLSRYWSPVVKNTKNNHIRTFKIIHSFISEVTDQVYARFYSAIWILQSFTTVKVNPSANMSIQVLLSHIQSYSLDLSSPTIEFSKFEVVLPARGASSSSLSPKRLCHPINSHPKFLCYVDCISYLRFGLWRNLHIICASNRLRVLTQEYSSLITFFNELWSQLST